MTADETMEPECQHDPDRVSDAAAQGADKADCHQETHAEGQQGPEAMQEVVAKPLALPARLQNEQTGAQGTPKAVASTLVNVTQHKTKQH